MIILASKSPRRIELLKTLFDDFLIMPSSIDEYKYKEEEIALKKGEEIASFYQNDIILSADTLVKINGVTLGKPQDERRAYDMLKLLSNKTHQVITYYCIICKNKDILISSKVISEVTFNDLSDDIIYQYIASKSPFDKAGGYGIQDNDIYPIIKSYSGSLNNIIGFPIEEIKIDLNNLGIKTKD